FIDFYEGHGAVLTRAYAGAVEALKRLSDEGYALGICTNKPHRATCEILGALDLEGYFSAVLGGDSLEGVRKPDPRHLLAAVERLGAARETAVMVGDTENDVAAARGAGVPVIAVAFGYARVPAEDLGADAVIGHFDELPDAIRRLA
ncbi:MAG: HAD-IA family hydrolase, partial [Alphaproteobacteria bacterium]